MARTTIFKLQRSLDAPHDQVLVYNEDRSINGQVDLTPAVEELFGADDKIFVRGYREPRSGQVHITGSAEPQPW